MDNPYWYSHGQRHHLDLGTIRLLSFELVNIFLASRALMEERGLEEAEEEQIPLELDVIHSLHKKCSFSQASKLLLQIALFARTYDDLVKDSDSSAEYRRHVSSQNRDVGVLSGSESFRFREACNKILHALEVRPLYERVDRCAGASEDRDLWFLTGEIELSGRHQGRNWDAVLYVQEFLDVTLSIVDFGVGEDDPEGNEAG